MADTNPLEAARAERERLLRGIENTRSHLQRLERKLTAVDKTIEILEPAYERGDENATVNDLLDTLEPPSPGITDAIRAVLQVADHYLTPTAVRDGLKQTAVLKDYENEMAVVHQVLRRLEKQGQIEGTEHPQHGKIYRWKRLGALARAAQRARAKE